MSRPRRSRIAGRAASRSSAFRVGPHGVGTRSCRPLPTRARDPDRHERLEVPRTGGHRLPAARRSGRWLELYAAHFPTVEVNATFYRLPARTPWRGWAERTPDGFVFAVKASRYLTHVKRLTTPAGCARCSAHRAAGRGRASSARRCGSCPRTSAATTSGCAALARSRRDATVSSSATLAGSAPQCSSCWRARRGARVGDHPERPFQTLDRPPTGAYVRFHTGARGRRGNYSAARAREWARADASVGRAATCTPTSTTTGRRSRSATPSTCSAGSRPARGRSARRIVRHGPVAGERYERRREPRRGGLPCADGGCVCAAPQR